MNELEFHPLSEAYPLMPAYELGRLEEGMRARGFDCRFPIVRYEKKILDGRNRYLAARAAEVKPQYVDFLGTAEEAEFFVQLANEERRHLAPEWLKRRREERIARVAERRQSGESIRTIAQEERVSPVQVRRDLEEANSNVPPGTFEPDVVVGKDGRGKKPTSPKRKAAADARRNGAVAEPAVTREPGDDTGAEGTQDAVGHTIPEACAGAFANLDKFKALDGLARQLQHGIDELSRLPGGEQLRRFLQPTGAEGKTINKSEHLNKLKRELRGTRPHSVCPYCTGHGAKSCKGCAGLGWVTELTWKDIDEKVKATL